MDRKTSKKKVVVVGGGGAGTSITRGLAKVLDPSLHELMLVSARPEFIYLPGALRVLVDKNAPISTVFMPYDAIFGDFPGELKIGSVSSIDENKAGKGGRVVLKTGEQVTYDVLAVATGSSWQGLLAFPDEKHLYQAHITFWRNKFEAAQDIIIVGGGAVGIETAGEIKDVYPNKAVTIVHNAKNLMSDIYPRAFRTDIERRLRRRGVKIILDDSIEGQPRTDSNSTLTTRKGTQLTCDLLVPTRGADPNTSLFKFMLPTPLGIRDHVEVEPTLQVRSHPSIFAAGDIVNLPEAKQFAKTAGHAKVIVANIASYLRDQPLQKECKPQKEIILVSIGKRGGAAYFGAFWGLRLGDTFTAVAKSRLQVTVKRRNLGLPAPFL